MSLDSPGRRDALRWLGAAALSGLRAPATERRPNIVYILADDLGYGDLSCLNPESKLRTTHCDRLAAEGLSFTDAHAGSAVCTPTRYGLLTGRYCWRTRLQNGVLMGDSPALLAPGRLTVASLLKAHGYHTACLGKWHLGLNWTRLPANRIPARAGGGWELDYSRPFTGGPCDHGFDWFYGISASLDMPPFVWLENDRATGQPDTVKKWLREGAATTDFEAVEVLPTLVRQAERYLAERTAAQRPFFLYLSLTAPHTPILPTADWRGRSGTNAYGDFVLQVDDAVGRVLAALDRHALAANTLVVMTSDNGCSPQANFAELKTFGHDPSHPLRGAKADIFEGGHRVPHLVRWPGRVAPGSTCADPICLTDLLATCADLLGVKLPANAGEDSVSLLPYLLGTATEPVREAVVHHSINGSFAIRRGDWKLELCPDSGGWSAPRPGSPAAADLPPGQLYDLSRDLGERLNEWGRRPATQALLLGLLERYVRDGRSTPGPPQANDVPVDIWRGVPANRRG